MRARDGLAAASIVLVLLSSAAPVGAAPGIGRVVYQLTDRTRFAYFRNGTMRPRRLITYVRYPLSRRGPFPLIVFGHGFAATPALYAPLLDAWTRAGYVVAAPVFPVENTHAPGGPNEADLINQPGDISFVISRLLRSSLRSLIDPSRIAVAGHSDGGETALAVAYDLPFRDPRVKAAVLLSGAKLPPRLPPFPKHSPPLLATQGSADTINPPLFTRQFFNTAPRPKYLLTLLGAGHLAPYTTNQQQLAVVEHVSIAFLNCYLRHGSLHALLRASSSAAVSQLTADP